MHRPSFLNRSVNYIVPLKFIKLYSSNKKVITTHTEGQSTWAVGGPRSAVGGGRSAVGSLAVLQIFVKLLTLRTQGKKTRI